MSVEPERPEQGLSSSEAAKRLRKLGPPPETSSRSVSSIVAGNVFTLFNAIIGVFFVLMLLLGLFADAVFGVIAIINSYIGIRQELKAKRTLDELAVLVAPQRQGRPRRQRHRAARRRGRARRRRRGRAGRPARRRRRGDRQPRADPRRVVADRRGRRHPQGPRRPGALGLLLRLRLGPLPRRRGARGELRRPPRRRGAAPSATRPRRCRTRSTG